MSKKINRLALIVLCLPNISCDLDNAYIRKDDPVDSGRFIISKDTYHSSSSSTMTVYLIKDKETSKEYIGVRGFKTPIPLTEITK